MAFSAHDPRVFYDAIVARLVASTGKNIGKSQAPADVTVPYAVVYPQDETDLESSLSDPHDLTQFEWFVTSVADTQEQVLLMLRWVRVALLGWQPVVAGEICGFVMRDGGQGVIRDDAIQPPKFYAVDRFTVLAD